MSNRDLKSSENDLGKGEQTREKIIVQALHTAAREGLGALSIGRLAKELKMSKSGLFVHFGSKEKLETAVIERTEDLFFSYVVVPAEEDGLKGIERLWALCDSWLKFVEQRVLPGNYFFTGAFFHCAGRDGVVPQQITEIIWRWLKALRAAIQEAQQLDELHESVDARQTAMELHGLLLRAQVCYLLEDTDRTQVRMTILRKLADMATEQIPASAFESLNAWRKYLESIHA